MNKWGVGLAFVLATTSVMAKDIQLLNVSYDPTCESYEQYDKAFSAHQKQQTGDDVVIRQSHGGSDKQATSVINGIEIDVVTLALAYDVSAIAERGWVDKEWIRRLPDNSAPYTSTIAFLVRKGNPKQIRDWNDLTKPGVLVVMPNPESSDGACWDYLATWGYTLYRNNSDQARIRDFVQALYKNVEVLNSGTRSSANTSVKCGIDDVLTAWESGALLAANKLGEDKFEIVTPNESILAEPTVSVVGKVVEEKDTKEVAETCLKYLCSPEGQEIAAENYYHPHDAEVAKKYEDASPESRLFTIDGEFSGWMKAQKEHFANSGAFDQISRH